LCIISGGRRDWLLTFTKLNPVLPPIHHRVFSRWLLLPTASPMHKPPTGQPVLYAPAPPCSVGRKVLRQYHPVFSSDPLSDPLVSSSDKARVLSFASGRLTIRHRADRFVGQTHRSTWQVVRAPLRLDGLQFRTRVARVILFFCSSSLLSQCHHLCRCVLSVVCFPFVRPTVVLCLYCRVGNYLRLALWPPYFVLRFAPSRPVDRCAPMRRALPFIPPHH